MKIILTFLLPKGIPVSEQEDEITRTLRNVDLTDKADTYTKNLSGGQKRKLSVGIAIIGSPKVVHFLLSFFVYESTTKIYIFNVYALDNDF